MSEKKRSTYKRGSLLDLPKTLDNKKYGFRWINANRLAENTDSYEPRGWEAYKDADGKVVKRGDLILGQMPIDMHEAMKEHKEDERKHQMELFLEQQAAEDERASHEFKKKGGKIKFEFSQE